MFMYFKNFKFNVYRPTISLIVYQTDRPEVLVGLGLDMLGLFPLLVLVLVREMKNEAWMRREREISHWYPSITCNISPSLFHKWCYKETLKKRIMTKAHIHITIYTREVKVDEWGRDLVTPKKEGCLGLCTGRGFGKGTWKRLHPYALNLFNSMPIRISLHLFGNFMSQENT